MVAGCRLQVAKENVPTSSRSIKPVIRNEVSGSSVSHILTPLRWDARSRTKCGPLLPSRHQNEDFPVLCSETKPLWCPSGKIYSFYRGWTHSNGILIFRKETPEGNASWIHFMILPLTRLLATYKPNQKPIG